MNRRGDDGQFYAHTRSASERRESATMETQTHSGRFTHSRDAEKRRMNVASEQFSAELFKNKHVNRDAYRPKVTK